MKTLVVYFSWSGTTERAAKRLAAEIGADVFELEPVKKYPASYGMTAMKALVERIRHARPAIKNKIQDFSRYDCILIGFPIWWYSCPMIILSFLKQYDFTGKQVYGFCTHGGSGPSQSLGSMRKACRTADIGGCADVNSMNFRKIREWMK